MVTTREVNIDMLLALTNRDILSLYGKLKQLKSIKITLSRREANRYLAHFF